MALLKIDTTNEDNFKEKRFDPIPKGTYRFVLDKKLELKKSGSGSGNNMLKVVLKCVDDAEDGKYLGRLVFDNLVLIPSCEWKLTAFALSSGLWTENELKELDGIDTDAFEVGETEFVAAIDIEHGEYQGKTAIRNVVVAYKWKKSD